MILTEQELQALQQVEGDQELSIQLLDNMVKLSHPELIQKAPSELEVNIQEMQEQFSPRKAKGTENLNIPFKELFLQWIARPEIKELFKNMLFKVIGSLLSLLIAPEKNLKGFTVISLPNGWKNSLGETVIEPGIYTTVSIKKVSVLVKVSDQVTT